MGWTLAVQIMVRKGRMAVSAQATGLCSAPEAKVERAEDMHTGDGRQAAELEQTEFLGVEADTELVRADQGRTRHFFCMAAQPGNRQH
jgi:hypothetical protein